MTDPTLIFWDLDVVPAEYQCHVLSTGQLGWLAVVSDDAANDIVEILIARWRLSGNRVVRHNMEDGRVVLVGTPG
ncbi:MAG TPA: hypothetical protein VFQ91_03780 [Bryobacteraceae bacterium]|nr:hypothetical protein [Bryobacteraceae bacterium]